ncbi:MAG TPA: hypothetical protein VGQ17_01980, partial [Gemmatimonadales bacterium]|nr:hypothetical protein [Gemmatimonadales bacterium]
MPADTRNARRDAGPPRSTRKGELPDYYIAPTRDFTQYTRDYEEKYWSKHTAFDWSQSVPDNLRKHVECLPPDEFSRVAALALPMVNAALGWHIAQIERHGLPPDDDALKAVAENIPFARGTIQRALAIQTPLERFELPVALLKDHLAILERQGLELREEHRLELFRSETGLKRLETGVERQEQARQLSSLAERTRQARAALKQAMAENNAGREPLRAAVRAQLRAIERPVLADLVETRSLVQRTLQTGAVPADGDSLTGLRDLVFKRQLRGLKDIANHALVVEQSAIAPLTMGIIHYKRRREIQEAMTTFVNDEAKHSAVFRRFMAEKLEATERIPGAIIKGGDRYLWIARFMPSGAVFLAVIVEAIGGAYLEFFGNKAHMPDPLFRSICRTIAERDEKRHMELCSATYNELYRKGGRWEGLRNRVALRSLLKSAYGDKTEDHQLIQACRA